MSGRVRDAAHAPARYATLAGLMWRASRIWFLIAVLCAVLAGVLPALMMVATGILVGSLGDAVAAGGFDSGAGRRALWGLALFGGASVGSALIQAGQKISTEKLSAAYVPLIEDRLAAASLAPERIGHLEDAGIAARFGAAAEASRENTHLHAADAGLTVIELRIRGLLSGFLLVAFHWWAPLVVLAGLLVLRWAFTKWQDTAMGELLATTGTDRRRAEYLRSLAVEPATAKELRIFGLGSWLLRRYSDTWLHAMQPVWRNRRRSSLPLLVSVAAQLAAYGPVLGVMAYQAFQGTVSVGRIAVYVQALGGMGTLGILGDITWQLSRAAVTAEHVRTLGRDLGVSDQNAPVGPSDDAAADACHAAAAAGNKEPAPITLSQVRFSYPGQDTMILDDLDLTVPAGQSVAIVGANGTGKSTLIKLLCGLYAPRNGTITVDGYATSDMEQLDALRSRVAVIFQDFVRYEMSLRDNIGFGAGTADDSRDGDQQVRYPGVDNAAVEQALHDAGAAPLADRVGWDTVLSSAYDGGTDLSGGQWQRIALARALAGLRAGAGVLILDEPTASLDVRAEAALFDRFLDVTRDTTTILVSHRLSSVRHADRIVVLDQGRITEDGSHADLMAAGGQYARMFRLQAERFTENISGSPEAESFDSGVPPDDQSRPDTVTGENHTAAAPSEAGHISDDARSGGRDA